MLLSYTHLCQGSLGGCGLKRTSRTLVWHASVWHSLHSFYTRLASFTLTQASTHHSYTHHSYTPYIVYMYLDCLHACAVHFTLGTCLMACRPCITCFMACRPCLRCMSTIYDACPLHTPSPPSRRDIVLYMHVHSISCIMSCICDCLAHRFTFIRLRFYMFRVLCEYGYIYTCIYMYKYIDT